MFGSGISQAIQPAIKSIARYELDLSSTDASKNTTIPTVDLTKSIVFMVEILVPSAGSILDWSIRWKFASATAVRVTRGAGPAQPLYVGLQVVEFWDLKSLQELSIGSSYGSATTHGNQGTINYIDTTIAAVDTTKALIIPTGLTYTGGSAGSVPAGICNSKVLTSSTNLRSYATGGTARGGNEACFVAEIR